MKTLGKVLITGGYGFIGSHVAERFNKEGYKIYILDDLSSGRADNTTIKHKKFNLNITDQKCEEIFRSNRFDVVVHLAAVTENHEFNKSLNEYTKSNILGLSNILELSSKYNVSKVIFASSADIYGNKGNGPYTEEMKVMPHNSLGISKEAGEGYCKYYSKRYNLETVILRISNVYGPRQPKQNGNLSNILQKVSDDEKLVINDNCYETRDYIYVEDVAFAIYQCATRQCEGTFNLSTNTENSLKDIFEHLKKVTDIDNVTYVDSIRNIGQHRLDNSLLINTVNWKPKYSLEEGLKKTLVWNNIHNDRAEDITKTKVDNTEKNSHKILPYLENFIGFMIIAVFSYMQILREDIAYNYYWDYKLIYIILIGIVYGIKQVSIAIALSCLLQIVLYLYTGRDIISFFYNVDNITHLSIYILIGLIIGYVIDRKNRDIRFTNEAYDQSLEDYSFLNQIYDSILIQKNKLENQIIDSNDSFAKIYETTAKLESVEVEDIYTGAINVIEKIMKTDRVTLYILDNTKSFMRLVAKSKKLGKSIPVSVKVSDYDEIQDVINNKGVYVNRKLKPNIPILISPVYDNEDVVGIVSIHNVKFEELSLYYENLFHVVMRLISSSLSRAYRYKEDTKYMRYKEDTRFLQGEAFFNLLKSKEKARISFEIDYMVLSVEHSTDKTDEEYYKLLSRRLSKVIRETDYLCMDEDNNVYILLSNIDQEDAPLVIERFRMNDVYVTIVESEKLLSA
ncbi:NAD-dependent epimerase/dehydratase family protein [Vallitalea sp.]|jgi:nucleoside-diphosphate-sugar epimerase|uniref:NAD-dependent epimerase/dehydratase family protein n=1 Tax=Vallitalea sp. TaxID=1882829 RepID=UPI0025EC271F|nr:NAD-dependent epimerase/dehydratase family protein [Vallitalea sp.]MCT4688363.1 NAD-dependent epimerase/dehydratase family protein [Vallitalea sp.]